MLPPTVGLKDAISTAVSGDLPVLGGVRALYAMEKKVRSKNGALPAFRIQNLYIGASRLRGELSAGAKEKDYYIEQCVCVC